MKTKNLLKKNKMTGGFFRLMKAAAIACGLCVAIQATMFAQSVTFTEHPRSQYVNEGEIATFNVAGIASWLASPNPQNNLGFSGFEDGERRYYNFWEINIPIEDEWKSVYMNLSGTIYPGPYPRETAVKTALSITAEARLNGSEFRYTVGTKFASV